MDPTKTRVKEHIGIVTNDTSTTHISFLVSPLKNKTSMEKAEYVILDHPTRGDACPIIAEVTEVKGYEEVVGSTLGDKNAGNLIATAQIIGCINLQEENRPIRKLLTPLIPGSRVYLPYAEFIEDTFTRDTNGKPYATPIHIGTMEATATTTKENNKPLDYYLNAEDITTKHTLITATDGAGKTHTATIIIKEIANKTQHPIVILDPYGEYSMIGEHINKPVQKITNPDKTTKDLTKSIKPNQITILNAEGLTLEEKKDLYTHYLKSIWKAKLEKTIPPLLLVVEDAETLKNGTLEAVAYEGTKHGVALILIAKHPIELGGKILTQTSTQIMGRTIDKDDLDYLKNLAQEKVALLPQLKQGEWIINSTSGIQPTQIRIKKDWTSG
jgi:DNA helicase HerA-like ATPase